MRLIDTETLDLHEFPGDCTEPYAILSHTWGADEITMQQMLLSTGHTIEAHRVTQTAGYAKVAQSALLAAQDGYQYLWVDTCCIDKTSSAELSEAINSMFRWYRDAAVCYAYLVDVEDLNNLQRFEASRWFTRGWTLQELIAPRELRFYSQDWERGATKREMATKIEEITGIPRSVIVSGDPSSQCIARRMSWAAYRSTTRVEDMAYCLMGIFDINMPMLYGEGKKAFMRLQEEIARSSDDQSIFAWKHSQVEDQGLARCVYRGLFARSPSEFCDSVLFEPEEDRITSPFMSTSIGLNVGLGLVPVGSVAHIKFTPPLEDVHEEDEFLGILSVRQYGEPVAIRLKQLHRKAQQFVRVCPDIVYEIALPGDSLYLDLSQIYVRQVPRIPNDHRSNRIGGYILNHDSSATNGGCREFTPVIDHGTWYPERRLVQVSSTWFTGKSEFIGFLDYPALGLKIYLGQRWRTAETVFHVVEATKTPDSSSSSSKQTQEQAQGGYWRVRGSEVRVDKWLKLMDDMLVCEVFIDIQRVRVR